MIQRGHTIQDDGRTVAVYRVPTVPYPLLPEPAKLGHLDRWSRFAHQVGADFTIWRVTRHVDADRYERSALSLVPEYRRTRAYEDHVAQTARTVREMNATRPEVYVGVRLDRSDHHGAGLDLPPILRRLRDARRERAVDKDPLDRYSATADREEPVRRTVESLLPGARRATALEVQWLYARAVRRGVAEPDLDAYYHNVSAVVTRQQLEGRFADDEIREEAQTLVVGDRDDHRFQTILAVGARPAETEFPGCEWAFHPLEALGFPADLTVHVRWMANADALRYLDRQIRRTDVAHDEAVEGTGNPPSWALVENRRLVRDLRAHLEHPSRPPLLWPAVSVAVGAPSREVLAERARKVTESFLPLKVVRPRFLQARLYRDQMPGTTGAHVQRYEDPATTVEFASLMPDATDEVGDQSGLVIGHTVGRTRRPVRINLPAGPTAGRPGWYVSGEYGSGKTILAQWLAYQAALRGSLVLTIDPKADHYITGRWGMTLPGLEGKTALLEMTGAPAEQGLLDPLVIEEGEQAIERTLSYYLDLIPLAPRPWQTQLLKAVKQVAAERVPCGRRVIEVLLSENSEDANAAGEELALQADMGLRRLGFADGTTRILRAAQVTTIRTPGIVLPDAAAARGNYSRDEQTGVATMKLLGGYGLRLLGDDRTQHKVLGPIDEAHSFRDNDGSRIVERFSHFGRTNNATVILLAQLESMVQDELVQLVGTRAAMTEKGLGVLTDLKGQRARFQAVVDPFALRLLNTDPNATAPAATRAPDYAVT